MFKFIFGMGIGVALGMIFAPASGEETRNMIAENFGDIVAAPGQKLDEALDNVQEQAGEIGKRLGQNIVESAVEAVRPDLGKKQRRQA